MTRPAAPNPAGIAGTFFFDPADRIYADHFPGRPVVPGSLIVHAFLQAAEHLCPDVPCRQLEDFGFREFLTPGAYPFTIDVLPDRLVCRLHDGAKTLAMGNLKK